MSSTLENRQVSTATIIIFRTTQKKNLHSKSARRNRHGPKQSWTNALPEPTKALGGESLLETIPHAGELLLGTEPIALHFTLDHIKRIAAQPERLTSHAAVRSHLPAGDVFALGVGPLGILVHHVLEASEPDTVRLRLSEIRDGLAAEDAAHDAIMRGQFPDAVDGAVVQAASTVGLGLEPDTNVLDWARQNGVGNAGEPTGHVVLGVRQAGVGVFLLVELFHAATRFVEGAELDAYLVDY